MLVSVDGTGQNQLQPGQEHGGCSSDVTLFFAKKSLTKTDRCAEALSCKRNKLLVLHFSGRFFLTEYLRRRRTSMDISFFTATISANCTSEFWALFKATKYKAPVVNTRRWLRSSRQWEVLLPYLYSIAAPEDHLAVYLCYVATNGIMTENEELWEILKKLARTYFKIQS